MATLGLEACAQTAKINPFAASGIDPQSPVAAQVRQASQSPGPYPQFKAIPPAPKDVRPVSAWRTAVLSEWRLKRQTEAQAAAIHFNLTDGEAWAQAQRARIPASEMIAPTPDAEAQARALAADLAARATPPPPPN